MTFTDTIAETINLDKAWLGYALLGVMVWARIDIWV